MTVRTLRYLLVLSLVLNVFGLAGFFSQSWPVVLQEILGRPPSTIQDWVKEIGLDDAQQEVLRRMVAEQAAVRGPRMQAIMRLREEAAVEMKRPGTDFAKIEALVNQVSHLRAEQIKDNFRAIATFETHLRPDQLARLQAMLADRYISPQPEGLLGAPPTGRATGLPGGPGPQ